MTITPTQTHHPLLRRCERFRHFAEWCKAFEVFSRLALPGLVIVFMLLIVASIFHLPALPLLITIPIWLAISLLWVQRQHKQWHIPTWRFPAYLDRYSGAKGTILQLFETGDTGQPLPTQAQNLKFPQVFPKQLSLIWLVLIAGYSLWFFIPAPIQAQSVKPSMTYTPLPVQQTETLINTLAQYQPEDDDFIASAQETLQVLKQRNNGLQPEDFAALENLQANAAQQLTQHMGQLQRSDAILSEFEQLVAQLDANTLHANTALDGLSEQLQGMQQTGLDTAQLQQLLATLDHQPSGNPVTPTGQNSQQQAENLQALQQQLRTYRENLNQELKQCNNALTSAELGQSGINRGPGSAPLEFSHLTFQRETAQLEPHTFQGQHSNNTVLLGQGLTARPETAQLDVQAVSGQLFKAGTDTVYWQKQTLPRHREVIEGYFAEE